MTNEMINLIIERINYSSNNAYELTRIKAIRENDEIKVIPDSQNDGVTFYHHDLVTDIERGFNVKCYLEIEDGKIIVRIY